MRCPFCRHRGNRVVDSRLSGDGAMIPPREICDITHQPTGTWVEIAQTGTVRAMSVIYLEFIGQKQPPQPPRRLPRDNSGTSTKKMNRKKRRPKILSTPPERRDRVTGCLGADVAPTALKIMGLPQPPEMTGQSLIP